MGLIYPFNQADFMKKWGRRDATPDPARQAIIDSGACTAFSALFAKLFQEGNKANINETQFMNGVEEYFRSKLEQILECQRLGKEIHESSGKGYEHVLKLVGLQPAGPMVQNSSQTFDISKIQGCLHVFTTSFLPNEQKHTIVHLVSGENVVTFDPNVGFWVNHKNAWKDFIISDVMKRNYNISTQSSFMALQIS